MLTPTTLWPLLTFLPGKVAIPSWQLLTFPWKEAVSPRQLLTFPQKEAVSPRQLFSFLLGKEAILSQQLLTFPWKEAVSSRPLLSFLLGKVAIPPRPLLSFLPVKEAVIPRQLLSFLPGKAAIPPRPLLSFLPVKEAVIPRQVNLTILLGQSGRAAGIPPGTGSPSHPRRTAPSPGKAPPPLPPSSTPQGSSNEEPSPKWVINLSSKPLTPAQRSVLAKGPNFAVTPRQPPNFEYITAIEAACTKLSQQDAEELRADVNRVLRYSHPPNPI